MMSLVIGTNDYINRQIVVNEYNIIEMKLELLCYVSTPNRPATVFRKTKNKVECRYYGIICSIILLSFFMERDIMQYF